LFDVDPRQLQSRYEKLPEFKNLLNQHDPRGKFRNEFLSRMLYT
jgi:xylitol oxidase